jgi:hydrogenase expression/formation protein HypD
MLKYLDEYRDTGLCLAISDRIKKISTRPFRIMEVCGGHTMSIRKNGIHRLVGEHIRLISGPGCPVCVTSTGDIDKVVAVSGIKGVSLCTFGDLFNVPGSSKSLAASRAEGDDVRIVYSAHDALKFAESEPDKPERKTSGTSRSWRSTKRCRMRSRPFFRIRIRR